MTTPSARSDEILARLDEAWAEFRQMVAALPAELLDDAPADGWSRKQILAHISAWHDLTSDVLTQYARHGSLVEVGEPDDVVNARVARAAEGRTTGEVVEALDASFRRLRRQVTHLRDDQWAADDGRAVRVLAESSYDHYVEHHADFSGD
jgi:hypothetical protein